MIITRRITVDKLDPTSSPLNPRYIPTEETITEIVPDGEEPPKDIQAPKALKELGAALSAFDQAGTDRIIGQA